MDVVLSSYSEEPEEKNSFFFRNVDLKGHFGRNLFFVPPQINFIDLQIIPNTVYNQNTQLPVNWAKNDKILPVCVLESKKVLVVSTVMDAMVPSVIWAQESLLPLYLLVSSLCELCLRKFLHLQ